MRIFPFHIRQTQVLLFLAAALFVLCPPAAQACEILVLRSADLKPYQDAIRGMRDASACDIRESRLDDFEGVESLPQKRISAVVAVGTAAFRKVRLIRDLPVLYVMVIPSEIERSLSPNISGVSMDVAPDDYLGAMQEVFPGANRIGLIYDPAHTQQFVDNAVKAARVRNMDLLIRQVRGPAGVPEALERLNDSMDVLWMLPDPSVTTAESLEYLMRYSIGNSVPVVAFSRKYVDMGAVASLDVDPYDMGVQAAGIAKRIIAGGEGPVRVFARNSRLTVNRKAASKMGITPGEPRPGRRPHER